MKIFFYTLREFDELPYCETFKEKYGIDYAWTSEAPNPGNLHLAEGCDAVSTNPCEIRPEYLRTFAEMGIRYLPCRSIGYDHIPLDTAKELGLRVSHSHYPPEGVANYTIMLMLMATRKMNQIMLRAAAQDYSLPGKMGKDLSSCTIGVIGTGVGGVLGARKELRGQRLRSITYVSIGAVGGIAGAALLLSLDPKIFEFAVPPLILFSSLIIAVNPRGRMQARQAAADVMAQARSLTTPQGQGSDGAPASALASTQPMSKDPWWIWLGVAFVAVYSGYFGAGAGTCALAVLDAGKIGPFHQINALKTLIGTGANISASVIFIMRGVVDWPAAILLCIGCFIGGYIASPVTRRIPARIMRIAAVLAGIVLTVDLALKTYL